MTPIPPAIKVSRFDWRHPTERSPTEAVVIGSLGVFLAVFIWNVLPPWACWIASGYALYETWSLINGYPGDTLSEAIWRLSVRPLVPWFFGGLSIYMIEAGLFTHTDAGLYAAAAWFGLQGHFFFQAAKGKQRHAGKQRVREAQLLASPAPGFVQVPALPLNQRYAVVTVDPATDDWRITNVTVEGTKP